MPEAADRTASDFLPPDALPTLTAFHFAGRLYFIYSRIQVGGDPDNDNEMHQQRRARSASSSPRRRPDPLHTPLLQRRDITPFRASPQTP